MLDLIARATTGVTGALPYDPLEYCILAAGSAIAWAYTIELDLLVFYTFRRRKGLYFWSLLISSWGCSLHALGFILKFLVGTTWLVDLPFIEIGWVCMVTGQAFVLYSRLHLVVRNQRTLRLVLWMIIFDAFALHVPTIVFTYGSNSPDPGSWTNDFNVMERIQLTGFCLQEFVIATVYITATVRLLGSIYHSMTRKVMLQLLLINFICIGMDIVLIGLEFSNNYVGEASVKPMIYAIKLKLEFAVLNQLMGLTKAGFTEDNNHFGTSTGPTHSHNAHEVSSKTGGRSIAMASTSDPDGFASMRKDTQWAASGKDIDDPTQIYKTEQVDVVTEPVGTSGAASPNSSAGVATLVNSNNHTPPLNSSQHGTFGSAAAAATKDGSHINDPPGKVKSLMGTPIVHMPRNTGREIAPSSHPQHAQFHFSSRPDGHSREPSPSESEKGITRKSVDSEKEGTRWIDGVGLARGGGPGAAGRLDV